MVICLLYAIFVKPVLSRQLPMFRLLRYLVIILLFCHSAANASHIYGGDLLYTHLGGGQYKITLTLYGDCSADNSLFNQLYHARPRVTILDTTSIFRDSLVLTLEPGSGIEVSPVCPAQINQTFCNGGTLPGVIQFKYSNTITLHPSKRWRFIFGGSLGGEPGGLTYSAGRSNSITNAVSGTQMQIEAMLNNKYAENSSPVYSTIPTPFYCMNVLQQYNQGAADEDGDSLSFQLVPAINAVSGASVGYVFPFSAGAPMYTAPGNFNFNGYNGQITFTPGAIQDALIVNQVNEYRNGVLVGTSEREMTFIVQDNCTGTPPIPSITSISGAVVSGDGTVINLCVGQPSVDFTISLNNPDGDNTDITAVNVPAGAALSIANNHGPNPSVIFSWNTSGLGVGHYTFYLTIKNNHCPLYNIQTVAYTINIASVPVIHAQQLTQTNCIYPAAMQYTVQYGFSPRQMIILNSSGGFYKSFIDSTVGDSVVIIDSLPAGTYTAVVRSDGLCTDSVKFTIVDSGQLPVTPVSLSYCPGDPSLPISITPVALGATIAWFTHDSVAMSSPPYVNSFSEGVYHWYFIETYNVCGSGPVPVTATVHGRPDAQILNTPQTICYGDDIYLQASGGVEYTWEPESAIKHDTGYYVEVLLPITVVVRVKDQFGCVDTASITYSNIQQCCRFSYPNAFTPNNDGNNDGFRVVTWGNMKNYALTIYNRWGQKVFFTADPHKAWDGTYGGEPCEVGTYYYYVDAACMTGPTEWHKGDVILIR